MRAGQLLQIFIAGVVAIGIVTALTLKGRTTVKSITALGKAGSGLIKTATSGK